MRLIGLIIAALLASVSGAFASCPATFSDCPPITAGVGGGSFTSALNLGGPVTNQQGVPFVFPTSMPTSGQILTATDNAGHTAWQTGGGGGGIVGPGSTSSGYVPLWNSTTGTA